MLQNLDAICSGPGADRVEAIVLGDEEDSVPADVGEPIWAHVLRSRFPSVQVTYDVSKAVRALTSNTVILSPRDAAPWSWGEFNQPISGARPLLALVQPPDRTAVIGKYEVVPWQIDREVVQKASVGRNTFSDVADSALRTQLGFWSAVGNMHFGRSVQPEMGTVACLIPYFRCATWLDRCLASVRAQTRQADAIILLADGGEMPPAVVLDAYPEVTLMLSDKHVGPYRLIQSAIEMTNYDWYMFQDADDWSSADRLEVLLSTAAETGALLIGSQEIRVAEKKITSVASVGYPLDVTRALALRPGHALLHPSSILARSLFLSLRGFANGLRFGGDTEFLLRAAFKGAIRNVALACYYRRDRSGSLTTAPETGMDSDVRKELMHAIRVKALANMARKARGEAPDLHPLVTQRPPNLEHIRGPVIAA
jgi:hypothetical protein